MGKTENAISLTETFYSVLFNPLDVEVLDTGQGSHSIVFSMHSKTRQTLFLLAMISSSVGYSITLKLTLKQTFTIREQQ